MNWETETLAFFLHPTSPCAFSWQAENMTRERIQADMKCFQKREAAA